MALEDKHQESNSARTATFLRRRDASRYLVGKYGFGAEAWLAKLAVQGGGPPFRHMGRIPLYQREALDEWAMGRIGPARQSTSDSLEAARHD